MLDKIKKLIYVIYPSGLGGEFLSYIISNSIVNCNQNFADLNPNLTGAWQGSCLFNFSANAYGNYINQLYIKETTPDFSKWFVCKDHPIDSVYNFLLKNFPNVKLIVLLPEKNDRYFGKICIYKTNKLIDATEKNLNAFLSIVYKELFAKTPVPRNWNHTTSETLVDYRPYMKKIKEIFFSSKQWWLAELWILMTHVLNGGSLLMHEPGIDHLIDARTLEYNNDIKRLQKYMNNFDTLVIPGDCYKTTTIPFFKILSLKFNILPNKEIINKFQSWINVNNEIQEKI